MKKSTAKTVLFNTPYAVWAAIFIIIPLIFVVYYSFWDANAGKITLEYIKRFATPTYLRSFILSVLLSLAATAIALVLAYPFAYFLSRMKPKSQQIQMILIMLPMWMNMLIRTYSWSNILENNGILNYLLGLIGIGPINFLGSYGAVILGMVYNYLPYMILPIYTGMSKIEQPLLEAADDLGCTGFQKLRHVIFPLSIPGVISGIIMVFVPSISTFYISQRMSNGQIMLIGDIIEMQIKEHSAAQGLNIGSAMAFILMVIILICTFIMNKYSDDSAGGMV